VRLCVLISVVCVMTAFAAVGPSGPCRTGQPKPGFDPKDVVRQVQARTDMSGLRSNGPDHAWTGQINRLSEQPPVSGEQSILDGEFLLDTNNALVPAPGSQNRPALAFDGANFLVVWEDYRSGDYSDICGARVTPQGTLLDPSGFVISQSPYDQLNPALAFDGANFLVVWQDFRRGYGFDIYGARVTPAGTLLDPAGLMISDEPNEQSYPALAFDGASFLVVWQDNRNNPGRSDIYGARVSPGGEVLDPAGLAISTAPHVKNAPAIGFDNSNFLVVWCDIPDSNNMHIWGARVTSAGAVLDPDGFVVSMGTGRQLAPCLSFDGSNYLVAWEDIVGFASFAIYGTRVTPGAAVLDPSGIAITSTGYRYNPALTFDGQNFLAVWQDVTGSMPADCSIHGVRVTPGGAVLDSSELVIAHGPLGASVAIPANGFDGANFLVVWQDDRNVFGEPDIRGARVTPAGTLLDTSSFVISLSAMGQYAPDVAFDGTNFLAVWEDDRSGYNDIYGARVTPGGQVLDPAGIAICTAAKGQYTPVVAFDGANYLVAWEDLRSGTYSHIYGARVTPGGVVLDPAGIVISPEAGRQHSPAIGFAGGNYLVVWSDNHTGTDYDIYGARVTSGGYVRDPDGIAISSATSDQYYPALASDGANFLVAWQDYRLNGGYSDVYAARVTPQGSVLDAQGFVVSQAQYSQDKPAVGFDGANFLAVWEDYRHGTFSDIYGARVTPGGTVLDADGLMITGAVKYQYAPVLAFNGSSFLVTWEDCRSSYNPDIYGAWVAPNGNVSDEGGVVREAGNQTGLALAPGAGSQLFLVYQGWAGTVGDKTYNTDRIWGDLNPSTGLGLEESKQSVTRGYRSIASVVRGVLFLPQSLDPSVPRSLLDISGRKVMKLRPGANDVRALAPGVYFVRDAADVSGTRKVVVQR
jgi:hypothetical protein